MPIGPLDLQITFLVGKKTLGPFMTGLACYNLL